MVEEEEEEEEAGEKKKNASLGVSIHGLINSQSGGVRDQFSLYFSLTSFSFFS